MTPKHNFYNYRQYLRFEVYLAMPMKINYASSNVASCGLLDGCSSLEEPTVPMYSVENRGKGVSFMYISPAVPSRATRDTMLCRPQNYIDMTKRALLPFVGKAKIDIQAIMKTYKLVIYGYIYCINNQICKKLLKSHILENVVDCIFYYIFF